MCGIAGTTEIVGQQAHERVLLTIAKRGPDGHGTWSDERVSLFHSRLSIIDVDARSNQPMLDPTGRCALIFNGEIYNYKQLRSEFASQYTFRTTSDTEVILAGYILYGHKIWSMLSGMFAVSLYDMEAEKIILARDHAGIKPLFYSQTDGVLTWGSEIKSIFALNPKQSPYDCIDPDRLADYFVLGYIPSPLTLYRHIFSLPRSTYAEYSLPDQSLVETEYTPIVFDTSVSIETSLQASVIEHLEADVPIGLFFSGGIDSSLLAVLLHKEGKQLQAFSLAMPGRTDDLEYSKKIADHLGLVVERTVFDQAAFDTSYEQVRAYVDVPLADVALFSVDVIAGLAAQQYKVVLSGEGGDELFYGYPRHHVLRHDRRRLSALLRAYLALPNHTGKGRVFQKLATAFDGVGYYIGILSPSLSSIDPKAYDRIYRQLSRVERLVDIDKEFYLENMLLRKLDSMTMANSLEGRVPLVSPRLYPYSSAINPATLEHAVDAKRLLKDTLRAYVPDNLIDRKKSGFGFSPGTFVKKNPLVRADFEQAFAFLSAHHISFTKRGIEQIWDTSPGLVLASILLVRTIENHSF
jgi:asparagine synthase (glutamine-hydrolysing)